ncbi:MAG: flagellar type III secretion system pore protein FliP [Planctomycetes bacterium]|nr:flagellar type III secretion system pore protein FliP [Planctomycetota bacterium]
MINKILHVLVLLSFLATVYPVNAQQDQISLSPSEDQNSSSILEDPSSFLENAVKPEKLSGTLEILLLMTVLSLAPAFLVMTTCFTRIVVVLSLLRQAMATQQLPPPQVIVGLALFMTLAVMAPTWNNINTHAIQPYVNPAEGDDSISFEDASARTIKYLRFFMWRQIENCGNSEDVYMFMEFSSQAAGLQTEILEGTLTYSQVSTAVLIPAFITSELKQAFIMGFYIYLPFLIIDMVIASILMSMGMMMLPPILISLPFKLLLFVLVDGWNLVIRTLMASFINSPVL